MAPGNVMPSTIGNLVAQRAKLSAIRQRINLEAGPGMPGGAPMRERAPSPPAGPDMTPADTAFDYNNYKIPEDKQAAMLASINEWLQRNGGQGQPPVPQNVASVQTRPSTDRVQAPVAPPPAAPVPPPPPPAGRPPPPATARPSNPDRALQQQAAQPIVEFFQANGRLPSREELRSHGATGLLTRELKRAPTPDELKLYLRKPAF